MNPYDYYLKRAQAIKDHDYRKLALIMCDHIGEDYSARKEIIQRKANLGNERDVRGMFETLTMVYHFPVCAHSGKAGYFVPPRKSATNRTRLKSDHAVKKCSQKTELTINVIIHLKNQNPNILRKIFCSTMSRLCVGIGIVTRSGNGLHKHRLWILD